MSKAEGTTLGRETFNESPLPQQQRRQMLCNSEGEKIKSYHQQESCTTLLSVVGKENEIDNVQINDGEPEENDQQKETRGKIVEGDFMDKHIVYCIMENQPGSHIEFEWNAETNNEGYNWEKKYNEFLKQAQECFKIDEWKKYEIRDQEKEVIECWKDFRRAVKRLYNKETGAPLCTLHIIETKNTLEMTPEFDPALLAWCKDNEFPYFDALVYEADITTLNHLKENGADLETICNDILRLSVAQKETFIQAVSLLSVDQALKDWCKDNGLEKFTQVLHQQNFKNPLEFAKLTKPQLNNIMDAAGIKAGFRKKFLKAVEALSKTSLEDWCNSNGLGTCAEILIENGYDDPMEFVEMEENELNEMIVDIKLERLKEKFLNAVKKLKGVPKENEDNNGTDNDNDNENEKQNNKKHSDNDYIDKDSNLLENALFNTTAIGSLPVEHKKKIKTYLRQLKKKELFTFIEETFGETSMEEISKELKKHYNNDDYDLPSVINQIINFYRKHKLFGSEEEITPSGDFSTTILEKIASKRLHLINKLKWDSNYLNRCLYHLVKSSHFLEIGDYSTLEVTDVDLLHGKGSNTSNIKKELEELAQLYQLLNESIPPSRIFASIALEANYDRLIKKEKNIAIFEAMQLLNDTLVNIELMKDQKLVLFMGDTGAGKSTSVNYFAGVKLKTITNKYGQQVVEVSEQEQNNKHAIIGQNLGTSQTSIARAYDISGYAGYGVLLVDFPGFDDTRGGHFNLCTALSIDRVTQVAKFIQSIVLVVSFADFETKRATPIIRLFQKLRARIPGLFQVEDDEQKQPSSWYNCISDPTKKVTNWLRKDKNNQSSVSYKPNQSVDSIFLLITKHEKFQQERESMKNRLDKHLSEAQEEYNQLIGEKNQQNKIMDPLRFNESAEKIAIWKLLIDVHKKDHIHFIDISDKIERKTQLQQYIKASGFQKDQFYPAMDGKKEQELWKNIELAVNTWRLFVMEQYVERLPLEIKEIEESIIKKNKEAENLEEQNVQFAKDIENLQKNIKSTENKQEQLLERLKDPTYEKDSAITQQLKEYYVELDCSTESNLKEQIIELERELKNEQNYHKNCYEKMLELQHECEGIANATLYLQDYVKHLSDGSEKEILYDCTWQKNNPNGMIKVNTLKKDAYEKSINENRKIGKDDREKTEEVRIRDYKGQTLHSVFLSRNYHIIPKDENERKKFANQLNKLGKADVGGYKADLIGERYKLHLGTKLSPDGKGVIYSIEMNWNGRDIPWFQIVYTIPNIDRNEATIINTNAEIEAKKATLAVKEAFWKELLEKELKPRKKKIVDLNEKKTQLTQELTTSAETRKSKERDNTISKIKSHSIELIKTYENNIKEKKETQDKNMQEIPRIQEIIKSEEERLVQAQQKKRYLAIVVQTQKNILKQLVTFAEHITQGLNKDTIDKSESKSIYRSDGLLSECQLFLKYYYQHQKNLLADCQQDINSFNTVNL